MIELFTFLIFLTTFLIKSVLFVILLIIVFKLARMLIGRKSNQKDLEELLDPLLNNLNTMQSLISRIDEHRKEEYIRLSEQISFLLNETNNLSRILRNPQQRGKWGEMQLRNVIESVGMTNYVSFDEQLYIKKDDKIFRPDMVIRIPGNKKIVIDSKAPFNAYIEACESEDELTRKIKIEEHIKAVKSHIVQLGKIEYHTLFESSPGFTILFLPLDQALNSIISSDLIDFANSYNIVIMTPILLSAMLRIISHGWQEQKRSENNVEICEVSGTLYKEIKEVVRNLDKFGSGLSSIINSYNEILRMSNKIIKLSQDLHNLGVSKENISLLEERDIQVKTPK